MTSPAACSTPTEPEGDGPASFLLDLWRGLSAEPRTLPCKYFYDARGSRLFDLICESPEYYVTRTEAAIMRLHAGEMATFIGAGGLGDVISNGINSSRDLVLITGSVLVAALALLVDWLAGIAEDLLRPRGL